MPRMSTLRRYNEVYDDAQKFINENFQRDISLDDFAKYAHTSRRQAQRVLTNFGTSWREMLTKKRMEEGRNQLLTTTWTVKSIARHVGYKQPAQFAKAFRITYGIAPAEFRIREGVTRRAA